MSIKIITILVAVLGGACLAGCGSVTKQERSLVGTTYQLTKTWCHMELGNGENVLLPESCTNPSYQPLVAISIPAGTCLTLGEARVLYPVLSRSVSYDTVVANRASTLPALAISDEYFTDWIVRSSCTPLRAAPGS
jgi:uncharacterized protein YceK